MNKKYSIILILSLLIACSASMQETFSGNWDFSITGDYNDEIPIFINDQNNFDIVHTTKIQGQFVELSMKGDVSEDGLISGTIAMRDVHIGMIKGKINYQTGEGKWDGYGYSGTWTAIKKE